MMCRDESSKHHRRRLSLSLAFGAAVAALVVGLALIAQPGGLPSASEPADLQAAPTDASSEVLTAVPPQVANPEAESESAQPADTQPAPEPTVNADGTYYDGEGRLVKDEQIVGDVIVTAGPGEALPAKGSELAGATVEDVQVLSDSDGETVAKVTISDGDATDAAMDELEDAGLAAQPNFVYHLLEDVETPLTAEEAEAAGVDVEHVTNDPANDENLLYHLYAWDEPGTTLRGSDVRAAWDVGRANHEVTVATIDTGCKVDHPDLKGNVNTDLMTDVYYHPSNPTPGSITDVHGHGTHVAGIIASVADNGIGGAGTSYNATVLPIKVFDSSGGSSTATAKMVAAYAYLDRCIEEGKLDNLKVINMSLGGYGEKTSDDEALEAQIDHFRDVHKVLTVCAGGNGDPKTNKPITDPSYPSDYEACLSVTALTRYGDDTQWSDYNPQKDISAPGDVIYATFNDGDYAQLSGTSMASPLVAGIAAMMYAEVPELTPGDAIRIIQATANEIPESTNHDLRVADGPYKTGSTGAIDAAEALKAAMVEFHKVKDEDHFILPGDVQVAGDQSTEYTGQHIEPKVTVTHDGRQLVQGVDYTVTYSKNVKPGIATLTVRGVEGSEGYGGYIDKTFEITIDPERQISLATTPTITIEDIPSHVTFNCTYHRPEPMIKENGQELVPDEDYTLSYADNKNAGVASVVIDGKGLYKDSRTVHFTIDKADGTLMLDSVAYGATLTLVGTGDAYDEHIFSSPEMTFTASTDNAQVATAECISEYQNLAKLYYNYIRITPHSPGDAVVRLGVNPNGNYNEVKPIEIKVKVLDPTTDLSNATMADIDPQPYTGQTIKPEPTVTLGGKRLVKDRDFEYSYTNCKGAGTGFVYAKGIGDYTGQVMQSFTITRADPTLTLSTERLDLKAGASGAVSVGYVADDPSLIEVTNLNPEFAEVSFDAYAMRIGVRALRAGSAAVRVRANATSNYNEAERTLIVSVDSAVVPVTSVSIEPSSLRLTVGDTARLTAAIEPRNATDQAVRWSSAQGTIAEVDQNGSVTAKSAGTTRVTATVGGRSSSIDVEVAAKAVEPGTKPSVEHANVTLTPAEFTYTGTACEPTTRVTLNGETLGTPADYSVAYENNTNAGTGVVTIRGRGAYAGEQSIPFTIKPQPSKLSASPSWSGNLTAGKTGTITVGGAIGALRAESNRASVATASVSGGNVTVRAVGAGSATITVSCAGDGNHEAGSVPLDVTVVAAPTDGGTAISPDPPSSGSGIGAGSGSSTAPVGGGSTGPGGTTPEPPAPETDDAEQVQHDAVSKDTIADVNEDAGAVAEVTAEASAGGSDGGASDVTWTVAIADENASTETVSEGPVRGIVNALKRTKATWAELVGSGLKIDLEHATANQVEEFCRRCVDEALRKVTVQAAGDLANTSFELRITCADGSTATHTVRFTAPAPEPTTPEPPARTEGKPLYRLYNPWTGEHLFTTSRAEYDSLPSAGWRQERIAWNVPEEGTPVYRLYNPFSDDHYYTSDTGEIANLVEAGWKRDLQGEPMFHSAATGVPVYQLFNPYASTSTHHWTADLNEYGTRMGDGWRGEDVKFHAVSLPDAT